MMAASRRESTPRLQMALVLATLVIGLVIEVVGEAVEPNGGKRFVGFVVIYCWLVAFFVISMRVPGKRRTLLVAGAAPLFVAALASIALSFPIYVLPAAVLLLAVATAKDSRAWQR
jgi:hypothetical protein